MAAVFEKNKSKIQAVFEHNLGVVVPRLHSVGLISEGDRDQALNPSTDSSVRAANLTSTVERQMVNYHNWWILVYVLLSSGLDADVTFFESLVISRPDFYLDVVRCEAHMLGEHLTTLSPLTQRSTSRAEDTASPPHSPPQEATVIGSNDEMGTAVPESPTAAMATNIPELELKFMEEDSAVHSPTGRMSSVWYIHAIKYPGIKFSNYYTRQTVTHRGDIIKGEGIELQIPGHAIERGESIEFTIQGCIEGPFELPKDVSFASPVFVITPHYKFKKEVILSEDIFVHLQSYEDYNEIVFLTSPSKPEIDDGGPHWNFQISDNKPQYQVITRRVWIQVKQFCLFCFGIRRRAPQYQYRVCLYSPLTAIDNMCRAVFSVSLYHEVFVKNLRVYLKSFCHEFQETCEIPQQLTQEEIKLCLPETTNMRYMITADRDPCAISKSAVDIPCLSWRHKRRAKRDREGYPPRIVLTITYTESLQKAVFCALEIKGVTDKLKAFNLTIPPNEGIHEMRTFRIPCHKGDVSRGPPNSLTMPNLQHLKVLTSVHVSIPQVIGNRSKELRDELFHRLPSDLKELDNSVDPEQNNCYILQKWIDSPSESISQFLDDMYSICYVPTSVFQSWSHLAKALKNIEISDSILFELRFYDGPLEMNTLLNFPRYKIVNIPCEVGVRYISFGTHLLQDATGAHVRALEHEFNRNCENINQRILEEWLSGRGRPVTWATLVEVLNIIDMGELAKMIEDTYVKS